MLDVLKGLEGKRVILFVDNRSVSGLLDEVITRLNPEAVVKVRHKIFLYDDGYGSGHWFTVTSYIRLSSIKEVYEDPKEYVGEWEKI